MIILKLIAITVIICYWIDLSGVVTSLKMLYWRWLFGKEKEYQDFSAKPFDCSLCMCHHIMLLYLLFTCQLTLFNYLVVCLLSFLSANFTSLILLLKDVLITAENKFNNLINK